MNKKIYVTFLLNMLLKIKMNRFNKHDYKKKKKLFQSQ